MHRPVAQAWWRTTDASGGRDGPPGRAEVELDEGFLDRPLFNTFAAMARRQPEAPAVRAGARSVSYGGLLAHAASLAGQIHTATEPDAAVAVLLPDPVDAACGILACLAAGRPCINLNPDHPAARLADILGDAGTGGLILPSGGVPPGLPCALPLILLPAADPTWADGAGSAPAPPPAHRSASVDAPGLVIYTSGSTGRPKGIVRSQRQLLVRCGHRIRQFRLTPNDRMLLLYPLSSGPGVTAGLAALLSGGTLHAANASGIGARAVLDVARDAGITTISGVPSLLRMLFALDGAARAFGRLRSIYTSSESLMRQDVDAWRRILPPRCAVRIGYGLTEGSPLADWFVPENVPGATARLPIGYPVPWHDFAITDADGAPVRDGQPGELWARGRLLSLGEWRQGHCVPGRLLADPNDPSGAILRTGDLVRRRPDGLLEFLGRIDEQIRIRGNRVEPAELEHVLRQTSGVTDAAIVVRRAEGDPVLVAFVVPAGVVPVGDVAPALRDDVTARLPDGITECPRNDTAARLRNDVTARLRATLPPYMLPARLHVISAVPKLPGGKVDPGALERLDDSLVGRGVSVGRVALLARGKFARLRRLVGFGSG